MDIHYNVTGKERKNLVNAISEITGAKAVYLGAPSFGYEVDYFTIDKDGTVTFDDRTDSSEIELLLEKLLEKGYEAEVAEEMSKAIISMPRNIFTEEALENLNKLIAGKGNLMKAAFKTDDLTLEITDDKISFPWFSGTDGNEMKAYMHFVSALCNMARTQTRISTKEKDVDNEKYAFRCFLLRLGFIGDEYKEERKILLQNLSGSSAFKHNREVEQ